MIRLPDPAADFYFRETQAILAEGGIMLDITSLVARRVTATVLQWREGRDRFTDSELATWAFAVLAPLGYEIQLECILHPE